MKTLSSVIAGIVICAALFVDSLQWLLNLIPLAGIVLAKLIGLGAGIGFAFWLQTQGELNWRTGKWLLGAGTLETLPLPWLDLLPAWTVGMVLIVIMLKWGSKVPMVGKLLTTK
jgi:hypothetical protein